ncbi:MAG TPA: hypothetical protein VK608_15100 [Edaphobacter sp.]|nr:hypothetical protein [Edaphobacter sp.]
MRKTIATVLALATTALAQSHVPATYKGTPHLDEHQRVPQTIPGIVQCAFYDDGGDGFAYHDSDPANHGSGELNPADGSYLHEFRMHEGVDISYAKFGNSPDRIDDNPWTIFLPPTNQLYVGWTEPGEWFNVTVDVKKAGTYTADLLYTSNRGGSISIDLNGKSASGELKIPTTYNAADPVAWRQWHHWNLASNLVRLDLPAGRSLLTIHIVSGGQMNLATFNFHEAK